MTPLEEIIRAQIRADGPMPLADYMALCLGHPEHGYYRAHEAIGAGGDFTTAPEISQMFGEIIGAWLAHAWILAGSPTPVRLVELGPGRGTLAADILRTLRLVPELFSGLELHLVETSPRLQAAQRQKLQGLAVPVAWHRSIAEVPAGPMLLVANEFFDALPIRQLVRGEGGWLERCVGLSEDGRLAFVSTPAAEVPDLPPQLAEVPEREVVEASPLARAIAADIGRRLASDPGAALIIDYGYSQPACGDSLQALRGKRSADPLEAPGEADLTAHVDFSALAGAAEAAGARVHGPLTQGSFLTALGIGLRAERLRQSGARAGDLSLAVERLTGAGGMGTLFKVLALTHPDGSVPPPFDSAGP